MTALLLFLCILLFSIVVLAKLYPYIYKRMSDERYWEPEDFYPVYRELTDEELFNKHPVPIEIIDTDWREMN